MGKNSYSHKLEYQSFRCKTQNQTNLNFITMKKLIHINDCYGGFCQFLKREYSSVEEFYEDFNKLKNLSQEEVYCDYNSFHPLNCSNPVLVEIELSDDEDYYIKEYDGLESISFRKKAKIESKVVKHYNYKP
jgi:hypothetical protein